MRMIFFWDPHKPVYLLKNCSRKIRGDSRDTLHSFLLIEEMYVILSHKCSAFFSGPMLYNQATSSLCRCGLDWFRLNQLFFMRLSFFINVRSFYGLAADRQEYCLTKDLFIYLFFYYLESLILYHMFIFDISVWIPVTIIVHPYVDDENNRNNNNSLTCIVNTL